MRLASPSRPLTLRPMAPAEARLRERAVRGLSWHDPGPLWRGIEVRLAGIGAASLARGQRAPGNGWLRLEDTSLLELSSGVPLTTWQSPGQCAAAWRLAIARLDAGLRGALGDAPDAWLADIPDTRADEASPVARLRLTLVDRQDGARHSFGAQATLPSAADWLEGVGWRVLDTTAAWDTGRLPVVLECRLGETRLEAGALAGLRPGDAVWLHGAGGTAAMPCPAAGVPPAALRGWLRAGALRWAAEASADGWRVLSLEDVDEMGDSMHDLLDGQQQSAAETVDALPICLSFVAGSITLPLAQLRGLTPGCVLPLGSAADARVRILANGVEIGEGELVDVGGQLAVQVARLGGVA